ncbi:hypothetical protein [Pseudobacter ginsenosidimutans]|nr:hypothetical protein [Pseudobacter ginsenosidimutans]
MLHAMPGMLIADIRATLTNGKAELADLFREGGFRKFYQEP